MDSVGLTIIPKLIPSPIHQAFVTLRWSLQSAYIKLQHQILQLSSRPWPAWDRSLPKAGSGPKVKIRI